MGADRLRVVVAAAITVILVIVATLVLDWFQISFPGIEPVGLDLMTVHGCGAPGMCASVSLSEIRGLYPTLAKITLFAGLGFGIATALTAGRMVLTGDRQPSLWSKASSWLGGLTLLTGFGAAYLFGPNIGGAEIAMLGTIEVQRTWAPLLLIGSVVSGFITLYLTRVDEMSTAITSLPAAAAAPAPAPVARAATPTAPPAPAQRGTLKFAIRIAELGRAGIDARREDGTSVLVLWRDVIGAVARRLPKELDGVTFIDIVSTAGATLRVVPWTKLSVDDGRVLDDQTDARRALALLAVLVDRCPNITLDPATRSFIETRDQAARLPDLETLAAHDQRLA